MHKTAKKDFNYKKFSFIFINKYFENNILLRKKNKYLKLILKKKINVTVIILHFLICKLFVRLCMKDVHVIKKK